MSGQKIFELIEVTLELFAKSASHFLWNLAVWHALLLPLLWRSLGQTATHCNNLLVSLFFQTFENPSLTYPFPGESFV